MSDLPYEIGCKPVRFAPNGWLQLHPAYEGWVPSEPGKPLGHAIAMLFGAVLALIVCVGLGL